MATTHGQYAMLPVEMLVLDTSNPRVARYIEMYGGEVTDEQMSLALGAGSYEQGESSTTFQSLRASIRTHGGLIHPILVNKKIDNELVVIEGNTRAVIYRQFGSNDDSGRWDEIPAIVYDHLDEKEIDAIRLQAHLVGPRQWDPYSKAKYLDYLSNSEHLTTDQIVDFCGGQRTEVHRFIDAYNDMERYYRPLLASDDQFDPTRFSAFVEMQAPRVQEALLTSGYTKTDFAGWVNDQILYPLDRVRRLPPILADPQARSVFLTDGARAAEKVLDSPSTVEALEDATLVQLANALLDRIGKMSYAEVRRLRENLDTPPENRALTEARDQLTELCRAHRLTLSHQCLNQRNTQTWLPYSAATLPIDSVTVTETES